jgi:hypothetical protein
VQKVGSGRNQVLVNHSTEPIATPNATSISQ